MPLIQSIFYVAGSSHTAGIDNVRVTLWRRETVISVAVNFLQVWLAYYL